MSADKDAVASDDDGVTAEERSADLAEERATMSGAVMTRYVHRALRPDSPTATKHGALVIVAATCEWRRIVVDPTERARPREEQDGGHGWRTAMTSGPGPGPSIM